MEPRRTPQVAVGVLLGRRDLPLTNGGKHLDQRTGQPARPANFTEGGTPVSRWACRHPAGTSARHRLSPDSTGSTCRPPPRRTDIQEHRRRCHVDPTALAPGSDKVQATAAPSASTTTGQARPRPPERGLRRGQLRLRLSPQSGGVYRTTTAAPRGRNSATTCTPTSTRSPSSPTTPARRARIDGGVWQVNAGGGRTDE